MLAFCEKNGWKDNPEMYDIRDLRSLWSKAELTDDGILGQTADEVEFICTAYNVWNDLLDRLEIAQDMYEIMSKIPDKSWDAFLWEGKRFVHRWKDVDEG